MGDAQNACKILIEKLKGLTAWGNRG